MKKRLFFVLTVLLVGVCEGWGQNSHKEFFERRARLKEACRTTPDTLKRQCGDTLYLLYDLTDTLQRKYKEEAVWWVHAEKKYKQGWPCCLCFVFVGPARKLTKDELQQIDWVTCEELEDFHDREYERFERLYEQTQDRAYEPVFWKFLRFDYYFDKVYLIIPTKEGCCLLQEVKYTSPGIV